MEQKHEHTQEEEKDQKEPSNFSDCHYVVVNGKPRALLPRVFKWTKIEEVKEGAHTFIRERPAKIDRIIPPDGKYPMYVVQATELVDQQCHICEMFGKGMLLQVYSGTEDLEDVMQAPGERKLGMGGLWEEDKKHILTSCLGPPHLLDDARSFAHSYEGLLCLTPAVNLKKGMHIFYGKPHYVMDEKLTARTLQDGETDFPLLEVYGLEWKDHTILVKTFNKLNSGPVWFMASPALCFPVIADTVCGDGYSSEDDDDEEGGMRNASDEDSPSDK